MAPTGSPRLLIVEDEPMLLTALSRILARDFDATCCATPQAAMAAFDASGGKFDAVLTDYSMPGQDGLQLARAFRDKGYKGPVAVLSGAIDLDQFDVSLEEGTIQKVLTKPWTIQGLISDLRELIASAQSAG